MLIMLLFNCATRRAAWPRASRATLLQGNMSRSMYMIPGTRSKPLLRVGLAMFSNLPAAARVIRGDAAGAGPSGALGVRPSPPLHTPTPAYI
eukprot:675468-Hanusia_phi.AAC.1